MNRTAEGTLMKWMEAGVFLIGLGVLIISAAEILKYADHKS